MTVGKIPQPLPPSELIKYMKNEMSSWCNRVISNVDVKTVTSARFTVEFEMTYSHNRQSKNFPISYNFDIINVDKVEDDDFASLDRIGKFMEIATKFSCKFFAELKVRGLKQGPVRHKIEVFANPTGAE